MTAIEEAGLEHLRGNRLTGVQYDLFEWESVPLPTSVFDAVPKAVILSLNDESVILQWDLEPPIERLIAGRLERDQPAPLVRRVDVSGRWHAFIGAQLVGVSWADHSTSEGLYPWAVTLGFGDVGELVVALGELIGGSPTYIPDSLLVTGSREAARAYRPPAALMPAWTDPRGSVSD